MSRKLKRCPFCGERAVLVASDKAFVICEDCGVATPVHDTEEEAIEVWNTRKPIDKVVEQLEECSVNYCKEYGYAEDENVLYLPDAIEILKGGAE